jgi:hypothetical protein
LEYNAEFGHLSLGPSLSSFAITLRGHSFQEHPYFSRYSLVVYLTSPSMKLTVSLFCSLLVAGVFAKGLRVGWEKVFLYLAYRIDQLEPDQTRRTLSFRCPNFLDPTRCTKGLTSTRLRSRTKSCFGGPRKYSRFSSNTSQVVMLLHALAPLLELMLFSSTF